MSRPTETLFDSGDVAVVWDATLETGKLTQPFCSEVGEAMAPAYFWACLRRSSGPVDTSRCHPCSTFLTGYGGRRDSPWFHLKSLSATMFAILAFRLSPERNPRLYLSRLVFLAGPASYCYLSAPADATQLFACGPPR